MNGKNHRSAVSEAEHIMLEIKNKSAEEIMDIYGFEIRENGTIYDPVYLMTFDNLARWVQFCRDQDDENFEEYFTHEDNNEDY